MPHNLFTFLDVVRTHSNAFLMDVQLQRCIPSGYNQAISTEGERSVPQDAATSEKFSRGWLKINSLQTLNERKEITDAYTFIEENVTDRK